jgi:hypothetical protein
MEVLGGVEKGRVGGGRDKEILGWGWERWRNGFDVFTS